MMSSAHSPIVLPLLLLVAGASAVCCQPARPDTDGPGACIRLVAGSPATRALLEGTGAMDHTGTTARVFDYLSDFEGTMMVDGVETTYTQEDVFPYFSDIIAYPGSEGAWTYQSGQAYRWTRTGTHHFFGWLLQDGASGTPLTAEDFFGSSLSLNADRTLDLPAKKLTAGSTPQLDFLYAREIQVAAAQAGADAVPLPFAHLFSALHMQVVNHSKSQYILRSVTLEGLPNTQSARVNFADGTVRYTPGTDGKDFIPTFAPQTLAPEAQYDLWSDYVLFWPQTRAAIADALLKVSYTVEGDDENVLTSEIALKDVSLSGTPLSETGFLAGKKYGFALQFKDQAIDLDIKVLPWDYTSYQLDYSTTTAAAQSDGTYNDGVLWFFREDGTTIGKDVDRKMEMKDAQETLTGAFYVATPLTGKWVVTAYPASAAEYFVIDPADGGDITEAMVRDDNGKVTFTVKASDKVPTTEQTVHFNVSIFFNGEWHNANSEFNRKDFRLVRKP